MRELDGRTHGLKASSQKRLQALFRRQVRRDALISVELARQLAELSTELNRQIGVLVDRGGEVSRVIVGEPARLYLPDIGRARAGQGRLRGLRLLRTELRGQGLTREDLADLQKLQLDLVGVLEVDAQGGSRRFAWSQLDLDEDRNIRPRNSEVASVHALEGTEMSAVHAAEASIGRLFAGRAREVGREAALLVGVHVAGRSAKRRAAESMAELEQLAQTAGVHAVDKIIQIRREIDPRTVLGKGKIEELALKALELGAELIIFDRDLAPSQLRAITNETDLKVIDRTQLILDIFARRAKSGDGKIQVELAQLKYALPRLIEKSTAMSRLTGGIGGQGPGETKLELHRRRARDRLHRLEHEIEKLSIQRGVRRSRRKSARVPVVSLVGYTNAGKSTLLNAMTNAGVLAEDKLFATLDTTSRRVRFPNERELVLTDTVGFIRDLPQDLVNAFKATLEELEDADLILHVIDAADSQVDSKMHEVEKILEQLEVAHIPRLVVINKLDATDRLFLSALRRATGGVAVSALTREGLDTLADQIEQLVFLSRLEASPLPVSTDSITAEEGQLEA